MRRALLPAVVLTWLAACSGTGADDDTVATGQDDDSGVSDDDTGGGDDDATPYVPGPPVFPGPGQDGFDAGLASRADRYDRQFLAINAAPFGMSLDAWTTEASLVRTWLDTGSGYRPEDFQAATGFHPFDLVYGYDEMGDLGMFGGVAGLGDVYRYALLRDDPAAAPDTVEGARERLETVLRDLHAMQAMTGRPGSLVRGIGRADQPGMEGVVPLPLFDDEGHPQPEEKDGGEWREDLSGQFPEFWWIDDTSKDQWDGYCLLLGAAWEVADGDATLDPTLVQDLKEDAREMAASLRQPSPDTGLDLTLIDGDGRPTTFHDLSALEFEGIVLDEPLNSFNALLALSGLKVLALVSGDADAGAFYREVAVDRGYADLVRTTGALVYLGYATNYSNVNMGWVALYSLLRFEADPTLRSAYLESLDSFWADGTARAPWHFGNALFNVAYAAFADVDDGVVATAAQDLWGFPDPPYTNPEVVNCDESELPTGQCIGIDGTTVITLYGAWDGGVFVPGEARGTWPVATSWVPQSIRPPSNFEWRSDPYRVNGGGGDRLNPGGDFRAAYWAGRFLERGGGLSPRVW